MSFRFCAPVFCEATATPEPGEGALDDASSGEDFEALGGIGTPYDLNYPFAVTFDRSAQLIAGVSIVGERMVQPWEAAAYGIEQT